MTGCEDPFSLDAPHTYMYIHSTTYAYVAVYVCSATVTGLPGFSAVPVDRRLVELNISIHSYRK